MGSILSSVALVDREQGLFSWILLIEYHVMSDDVVACDLIVGTRFRRVVSTETRNGGIERIEEIDQRSSSVDNHSITVRCQYVLVQN